LCSRLNGQIEEEPVVFIDCDACGKVTVDLVDKLKGRAVDRVVLWTVWKGVVGKIDKVAEQVGAQLPELSERGW